METQLLTQPKLNNGEEFTLGKTITSALTSKRPKYKTVNFIFGIIKSNAIEHLKPYMKEFIDNDGTINFFIDSDKRIINSSLVSDLINMGCNIYVFKPENESTEFQYRGCILETTKKADIYLTSGNLSMNGLFESFNIITHLSYDNISEFNDFKNKILFAELLNNFHQINSIDDINSLNLGNVIPSISEFTKKKETTKKPKDLSDANILIEIDDSVDFLVPTEIPKEKKPTEKPQAETIVTPKIIDTTPVQDYPTETIYYNTNDVLDVENFLFESKSHKSFVKTNKETVSLPQEPKIYKPEIHEPEPLKNKIIAKPADLSKTTIFMFEASKITKRGICAGEIKIPVYLRDMIEKFWDWPTKYSIVGHAKVKSRICKFNIIDTANPEIKIKDENVKLFQREDESSFSIHSKELEKLNIAENDIIRLIKTQDVTDSYYTCEIVRTNSKEFTIWEQFCTGEMKNSKRKYGIM